MSSSTETKLSLLTLNVWGLKAVSKHRVQRLQAIASRLKASGHAIIALQEIWCSSDWEEISQKCIEEYPFQRWFSSGIITGPGLAILSKHPIKETFLYRFPVNGRPSAVWRGDWYVGKSASVTVIDVEKQSVAVLNSHLHAPYSHIGDAKYECHRAVQAWDFQKLINWLKESGKNVIVVGDLNSRKGEISYDLLTGLTGLVDSWEQVNDVVDLEVLKSMSPIDQVEIGGVTCDSVLNTWRATRKPWEACRLDYALVDPEKFEVLRGKVVFTEQIPGIGSYSDHFGYEVDLKLKSLSKQTQNGSKATIREQIQIHKDLKMLIDAYKKTSIWQKTWRMAHFYVSIVVLIVMLVVTSFTSTIAPWSSVLWVLFSIVVGITGAIDGILGFVFGNYEMRQLKEVELEAEDGQRWLEGVEKRSYIVSI